jgi:alkaline phosphatase
MVFAGLSGCEDNDDNGGGKPDLLQPPAGADMAEPPAVGDMAQTTPGADMAQPPASGPFKRVIFFVGDGMGLPIITASRIYSVGEDGQLTMDTLPESGFVHTFSNDALVTDSAPSMSAYMTGVKCNNEVLSMTPDTIYQGTNGAAVWTLLETAKLNGFGTGVVTTTRVTHATPAATYAHINDRDQEDAIATQLAIGGAGYNPALLDGVDVVFGGGRRHFLPADVIDGARTDKRNLIIQMGNKGYQVFTTRPFFDALDTASAKKVIGLFTKSHMSYEADRDPKLEPSLSEMTAKAMDVLKKRGSYFLMVEGGRIDHAEHFTNVNRAIQDTLAFDAALKTAIEKAKADDPMLASTLIVVTADHDHTLSINGEAKRVGATTMTNPGILGFVRNLSDGMPAVDADSTPYTILNFGNGESRVAGPRSILTNFTEMVSAGKDYHQEVAFHLTNSTMDAETHGGADVAIMAIGYKASQVHGFMDNTQVYSILRNAAGF